MIRRCRKVVDSNYLGREELRHWLAASSQHYAVITAAALTEVVKGNALRAIVSSMAILSEFPRQVIILKNDAEVARLTESVANPQLRLIDKTQTAECESAWNKDPVFGVIGIETGPLRIWVTLASIVFGSRGLDVGRGDNCKDPTGVFQAG